LPSSGNQEILRLEEIENRWESRLKNKNGKISLSLMEGKNGIKLENIRLEWAFNLFYVRFKSSNFEVYGNDNYKKSRLFKNQGYKPMQESGWISGLLKEESPETIRELEQISEEERLTLAVDTGILIRNLLSRQVLPNLGKVKWIQIVIPSCVLWELENKVDQKKIPEMGEGYLGLQEVVKLKKILPTFIVEDKPEVMLPARIHEKTNIMRDHLICRQIKDFMKRTEVFKHVYLLTVDKTLASIGKVMDIDSLYIPHPEITKINEEYELKSISYSFPCKGWIRTPLTRFLWTLAYKFTEISVQLEEGLGIRIRGDYPGKLPKDWIDGKVLVEEV